MRDFSASAMNVIFVDYCCRVCFSYNAIQETLNTPPNVDSKFISLRYMDIDLSDDEGGDD